MIVDNISRVVVHMGWGMKQLTLATAVFERYAKSAFPGLSCDVEQTGDDLGLRND